MRIHTHTHARRTGHEAHAPALYSCAALTHGAASACVNATDSERHVCVCLSSGVVVVKRAARERERLRAESRSLVGW